jgi:hypothetical protein
VTKSVVKPWLWTIGVALISMAVTLGDRSSLVTAAQDAPVFTDDFENGLARWDITGDRFVSTRLTDDAAHRQVMQLETGGDVLALINGSERWGPVRLEGDVLFPTDEDNYLGVAYNHQRRGDRDDFGLIYIKGNDNYLQVNPHRDFNVSRLIYPEGRATLAEDARIVTGQWQRFAVEVVGAECHFYVGDMRSPQLTFSALELSAGALGLQPRSVGGPVWVDNVRVNRISQLSYDGPPRPAPGYGQDRLLTDWQVIGPLARTDDAVAEHPTETDQRWQLFAPDARGAVVTGRVVDYHGPRTVGYFRTSPNVAIGGNAVLHLSTADDLAVWVNGRFHWFVPRGNAAWFDFATNPQHRGQRIPVDLQSGPNDIVIRVRGGVYATGGFFARLE